MWDQLLKMDLPAANLVLRASVVYVATLLLLRISGKRQMGQMAATEFVAILLISNAVQNAMNGGDNSLSGGLLQALTLIVLSTLISVLTYRSRFFSALFEGTPTVLIHKGKVIARNLKKERLSLEELRALLRKQGIMHIHDVHSAILEADGTLSLSHPDQRPVEYISLD